MYSEEYPDVFRLPEGDPTIWRYMSLEKLISLLKQRALFFCRTDRFEDPFEGSYPKIQSTSHWKACIKKDPEKDSTQENRLKYAENWGRLREQFKEAVLVNCWHINGYESEAMWRLYAQKDNGVAIRSTVQRLKDSFTSQRKIYIGAVEYVDFESYWHHSPSAFVPFVLKNKTFEYERELRAVFCRWDRSNTNPITTSESDSGELVNVDLEVLIEEVRLHPFAPNHFREYIEFLCKKFDLSVSIGQSTYEPLF